MSLYNNWREALPQVISGDNFQYSNAIDYYATLKNRMIQSLKLANPLLNAYTNEELSDKVADELNNTVAATQKIMDMSQDSLTTIQNWVKDAFENNDTAKYLQSLVQEINDLEQKTDGIKKENTQQIQKIRNEIKAYFSAEDKIIKLATQGASSYTGNSGDYNSVLRFLESFLINSVRWRANLAASEKLFINKNARTTLAGYYKEIVEKKLLIKKFSESPFFVSGTVDLVAGKNTISDLLLGFDSLNGNAGISQPIGILSPEEEQLESKFGVQIKLRDIDKVKTAFMKISHQAGLRDAFNAQLEAGGYLETYAWSCGVAFLGQSDNIIQSLGRNNVLFITGPNRMFMDAFISHFRSMNMYLAFQMDGNHKATSQVGLQRYVQTRGQNQTLLKRFQ